MYFYILLILIFCTKFYVLRDSDGIKKNLFFSHKMIPYRFLSLLITKTHLGTQFDGVLSTSQAAKYLVVGGLLPLLLLLIRSNFDIFLSFFRFAICNNL